MRILLGLAISVPLALAAQTANAQKAPAPVPVQRMIPGTVGQGPLKLTSSAAVTYHEYFAHACPQVLTVDAYGWATHAVLGPAADCPLGKAVVSAETMKGALNACEAYSRNPPCSVVAVGRKVVWDGPISFVPGRFIPQGDHQLSIVLRKTVQDGADSPAFETAVGLIATGADGRTGEIEFQRHAELGRCRGSLTAPPGEAAAIVLTCTKSRAVAGSVDFKPDARTGSGTAADGGERHFVVTVLPPADFMKSGTDIYTPPAAPGPAAAPSGTKAMTAPKEKGAS